MAYWAGDGITRGDGLVVLWGFNEDGRQYHVKLYFDEHDVLSWNDELTCLATVLMSMMCYPGMLS